VSRDYKCVPEPTMDSGYLDSTPVRPPPPGQTSNFFDPESRSYQLVILIGVLTALVATFLLLRLYIRLGVTKSYGIDDCTWFPLGPYPKLASRHLHIIKGLCTTATVSYPRTSSFGNEPAVKWIRLLIRPLHADIDTFLFWTHPETYAMAVV
jgi:hypothetical protein